MDTTAAPTPERIVGFTGEHEFLSNSFREKYGLTTEHRFQKSKTFDLPSVHRILDAATPQLAIEYGRVADLRPDWDLVKVYIMSKEVAAKFTERRNTGFAQRLLDTGDRELVDTGDDFWGTVDGVGANHLGQILMDVRANLRAAVSENSAVPAAEPGPDAVPAVLPAPASDRLPVLEQAVLDALSVKGFTRQSLEARAKAIVASIESQWSEILADAAPGTDQTADADTTAAPASAEPSPAVEPEPAPEPALAPEEAPLELAPEAPQVEDAAPEPAETPAEPDLPEPVTEDSPAAAEEPAPEPAPVEAEIAADAEPVPADPTAGRIIAATDGSAAPTNPGPAGWGWYVNEDCWAAGAARHSTNNRAELAAMMNLFLATADSNPPLHILCDSQYVIGIMAGNNASANTDLVARLRAAMDGRDYTIEWVKGHSGHPMNEAVDEKCTAASSAIHNGLEIPTGPGWTLGADTNAAAVPLTIADIETDDLPF